MSRQTNIVNGFINKWAVWLRRIKNASTMLPNELLHNHDPQEFCQSLRALKTELANDYQQYILKYFPTKTDHPDADIPQAVISRLAFYSVWRATCRLLEEIERYLNKEKISREEMYSYLAKLNIPSSDLFHTSFGLIADIVRNLHLKIMEEHIYRLSNCEDNAKFDLLVEESTNPDHMLFTVRNKSTNFLLRHLAELDSYPSLPINMCGRIASTSEKEGQNCELLEMGPDNPGVMNRDMSIINYAKERVCSICKMENVAIGFTDDTEQRMRRPCNCVFLQKTGVDTNGIKESFYQHAYFTRSMMIQRLLLLTPNVIPNGLGCRCIHHVEMVTKDMKRFKEIIDSLGINHNAHGTTLTKVSPHM